jgi:hypothetical protein
VVSHLFFTFHMRCISIVMSLYFRIFSASYFTTFLFPEIAASVNIHVPFSLSRVVLSGLLLWMVLSVCLHLLITQNGYIAFWLIYTDCGTWSCQCCLSHFTAISLHFVKCSWAHTSMYVCMYVCVIIIIIIIINRRMSGLLPRFEPYSPSHEATLCLA